MAETESAVSSITSTDIKLEGNQSNKINEKIKKQQEKLFSSEDFLSADLKLIVPKVNQSDNNNFNCLLCQCKMELHPTLIDDENFLSDTQSKESQIGRILLENSLGSISTNIYDEFESPCTLSDSVGNCNLLDLISKSSNPLDVPMCKKCATSVASELQKQLEGLEQECIQYKQTLDKLTNKKSNFPFDQNAATRKLEALKTEERDLLDQLNFLEEEERVLSNQLNSKMEERRKINERDEELYRQLRNNHRTLIEQTDEQRALKLQIKNSEEQLKRLCQTNILDLCFHIWVDGEFGTISGFRLGRLRQEQVEWNEINAALGQMAFLLKVISERLGIEFVGYELVPFGSCSFIRSLRKENSDKIEELPLYGSGGWRPFGQPTLDKALIAFMDCFIQERWSKAMKCLLLNMKRVIGILTTIPIIVQQQQQNSPQLSIGALTPRSNVNA
uniref:APG6 domain-containing protein n=1 Tax=Meloidogyne hapla TaxID=6305 RepID=A0A1I8BAH9_MELHA